LFLHIKGSKHLKRLLLKGEIAMVKNRRPFEDIIAEMTKQEAMSIKTNLPMYHVGDVIDEEKSIRWNREEVAARNAARDVAILNLRKQKAEWRARLWAEMEDAIVGALNDRVTAKGAEMLWSFVYDDAHSAGLEEVLNKLYDLLEIYKEMIKKEDK